MHVVHGHRELKRRTRLDRTKPAWNETNCTQVEQRERRWRQDGRFMRLFDVVLAINNAKWNPAGAAPSQVLAFSCFCARVLFVFVYAFCVFFFVRSCCLVL